MKIKNWKFASYLAWTYQIERSRIESIIVGQTKTEARKVTISGDFVDLQVEKNRIKYAIN